MCWAKKSCISLRIWNQNIWKCCRRSRADAVAPGKEPCPRRNGSGGQAGSDPAVRFVAKRPLSGGTDAGDATEAFQQHLHRLQRRVVQNRTLQQPVRLFYQVLNLSDRDKTALAYVERLYRSTGRIPLKEDVSKELRKKLQSACGTWVNALFQIGIAPADYYDALKRSRQSGQKA